MATILNCTYKVNEKFYASFPLPELFENNVYRKKQAGKKRFCRASDHLVLVKPRKITWLSSKVTDCMHIILVKRIYIDNITIWSLFKDDSRTSFYSYNRPVTPFLASLILEAFLQELRNNSIFFKNILLWHSISVFDWSVGGTPTYNKPKAINVHPWTLVMIPPIPEEYSLSIPCHQREMENAFMALSSWVC